MRALLASAGFVAGLLMAPLPSVAAELIGTNCNVPEVAFAPCNGTQRLFKTIIVGVPGWNGKCDSTFGAKDQNVLNVMREPSFFDVDCFDYDSHTMTLQQSEDLLRSHLDDLQRVFGYEEVSFITHSTGGVLVLKLLLDELLTPDRTAIRSGDDRSFLFRTDEGSLRVRGLFAWGTPINGVREHVCRAGEFANLFSLSPAVLPHLCEDSPFLVDLRKQYEAANALFGSATSAAASGNGYDLFIFQGQDNDWVVNPVFPGEPWVPLNARFEPVDTAGAHTSIISTNGTNELPTFAGLTMTQVAQLTFSLLPRKDEYFRLDLQPSQLLDRAQMAIVDGVVDFAGIGNLFFAGSRYVSDFTVTLLAERFVRSPEFDAHAVERLDALLRKKIEELRPIETVHYADTLLSAIDRGYQRVNETDLTGFGGHNKQAVRKLVVTVADVFGTVKGLIADDDTLEEELISSGTLEEFERRVQRVVARLLEDQDEETRTRALIALKELASQATDQTVAAFDFEGTFAAYGRENFATATAAEKKIFGDALLAFSNRSADARVLSLEFLSEESVFLDRNAPMWAPLLNNDQLRSFVESGDQSQTEDSSYSVFLGTVIGNAGIYGQSAAIGTEAVEQFRPLFIQADEVRQEQLGAIFVEGLNATDYPAVRGEGMVLLNDLNLSAEAFETMSVNR